MPHVDCLLVHGWMVTSKVWRALSPLLGGRAIAPDLVPAEADAAAATLDALAARAIAEADRAGLDRFHLVGHSMGGQIAQLVAAAARDRVVSLSLVNAVPLSGLPLPDDVRSAFRSSGGDRAAQAAILAQACLELRPDDEAALLDDAATVSKTWIARGLDLFVAGGETTRLAEIACPTQVIATDDPFLPPAFLDEAIVSRIRGARLAVLRGPGHYPQIERPEALATLLRGFFAESTR